MQLNITPQTLPFIQKQINDEETKYQDLLKKDEPLFVLKEVRLKIKKLKLLEEQAGHPQDGRN